MRKLDAGIGLVALAVLSATITVVVISSRDSTPQVTAQQETFTLETPASPAGCGTVIAKLAGGTQTPQPGTEWTFHQNAYVKVTATAKAGCTFSHWVYDYGSQLTRTDNPFQFQLISNSTVTAHFTGTPAPATATPTATATTVATPVPVNCTQTTLGIDPLLNTGLTQDCATLLRAKDTLRGTGTLNWSEDTAMKDWDGITLSGTPKRVTSIALGSRSLTGTIPSSLGTLSGLRTLSLDENQLTGTIPAQLGNLAHLTELHLNRNRLTGGIPTQLGDVSKLQYLSLGHNQLSGAIPVELGNLTGLTNLWLKNNQLTGGIPTELGNLTKLRDLVLNDNQLTGTIPPQLGNLTKLTRLVLDNNQLTGDIPEEMENLKKLIHLHLSGNSLTGCVPGIWADVANNDFETLALPYCGAVLEYDSYDRTGTASADGSHAVLMDSSPAARVAEDWHEVLDATVLVVNTSDSDGATRTAFYNSLAVGDIVEWYPMGYPDCWLRYRVTAILADPTGDPPRKRYAVESLFVAFELCVDDVVRDDELVVELRWNPNPAHVREDGLLLMLKDQPVEGGATYLVALHSSVVIDVPEGMTLVRTTGWVMSSGRGIVGLKDVESGSLLHLDQTTGEELSRRVKTIEGSSRDVGALFDSIVSSVRGRPTKGK